MDKQGKAFATLKRYREALPRQIVKTLYGQIRSGDVTGAMKGLSNALFAQSWSILKEFMPNGEGGVLQEDPIRL